MASSYCWIPCILLVCQSVAVMKVSGQQDFRLPQSIIPTHYTLRLQPILDEIPGYTRFTAPGTVRITVNCTQDTNTIKLHALDLTIIENSTEVKQIGTGQSLRISSLRTEPEHHFFVISAESPLKAGSQYEIFIQFITPVSQSRLDGMYLDNYVDPITAETRYVATTLFAAISARRCFPSFDEPQMKAIFSVELVRMEGYHSLSNRHQISTEPLDGMSGWFVDKFAPSLRMSTYLVAMIVSDMTYEEAVFPGAFPDDEDTTIRVYAPYYLIDRGGGVYAANQTKTVLANFENYLNFSVMISKLDSVSLPRFYFSAMENWGLITYNDRVLLYFPGETTEPERYRITSIIAHEVSHSFFGNLVTCEWWTWIWLNEGGATYFSYHGVEMTYPEFNPWDRFITDVYQVAMDFDSTPDTHPVANEPNSLADIGGIYDDIAYEKGATLLKMMQSFLTEEVMQTGIRKYLKEKQFSTAQQDDLFQILQETAEDFGVAQPATIKDIMDTWTALSGYPLLHVFRTNATHISISQEKFEMKSDSSTDDGEVWWIPISISVISPTPKEHFFWMSNKENVTTYSIPETEVFVVNPRSEGYFRTLYSADLLESILLHSKSECHLGPHHSHFLPTGKAKLINDYLAFKQAGLTSLQMETIAAEYLCLEKEKLIVWETLFKHYQRELLMVYDARRFNSTALKVKSTLVRHLLPSVNKALKERDVWGGHDKKGEEVMLHAELIFWTCFIDVTQPHCITHVENKMNEWIEKNSLNYSPFPINYEETYFCIASSLNNMYWEQIYNYMESKHASAAKERIANSLMCTSDTILLQKVLPQLEGELKPFVNFNTTMKLPVKPEKGPYLRTALRLLFNDPARKLLRAID